MPDEVLLINQDASVFQRVQLPQGQFASRTIFVPELGIVLLGDYCSVRVWTIETNELSLVEGTILNVTGSRAAFYVDPEIVVRDLVLQCEVLRFPAKMEVIRGSAQMAAAISPNGDLLAACHRQNEVTLIDASSGRTHGIWKPGFTHISHLAFSCDGAWLLARGTPRPWSLLCFDVAAGIARAHWPRADQWPPGPNDLRCNDFAIEPGGRRVALTNGTSA